MIAAAALSEIICSIRISASVAKPEGFRLSGGSPSRATMAKRASRPSSCATPSSRSAMLLINLMGWTILVGDRIEHRASMPQPVFRFAPSPNGELHLGHAYSALFTDEAAKALNGVFLLRIED